MSMARLVLSVDTSDCVAVAGAAAKLAEALPWPAREDFRAEVQRLFDAGRAVVFIEPVRGPMLEAIGSPEFLDLMRRYEAGA